MSSEVEMLLAELRALLTAAERENSVLRKQNETLAASNDEMCDRIFEMERTTMRNDSNREEAAE